PCPLDDSEEETRFQLAYFNWKANEHADWSQLRRKSLDELEQMLATVEGETTRRGSRRKVRRTLGRPDGPRGSQWGRNLHRGFEEVVAAWKSRIAAEMRRQRY